MIKLSSKARNRKSGIGKLSKINKKRDYITFENAEHMFCQTFKNNLQQIPTKTGAQ